MASNSSINLTARDAQMLDALVKSPLDTKQLLSLSQSFDHPFTHDRLLRRRMTQLVDAGLVHRFQYATIGVGGVNYYKVTPTGYRLIEGPDAKLPSRSYFRPVSLALQEHTRALADFIVKTYLNAHSCCLQVAGFYRENQVRLTLGQKTMQPDCAFQLLLPDGKTFNYLVEIDCGTEPIRSTKQRESLEQKIRFYDRYQDAIEKRFRVIVLFTKASARLRHFMQIAHEVIGDPRRTLCCAGLLSDYVQDHETLFKPLFLDRFGHTVPFAHLTSPKQPALADIRNQLVFLEK